MTTKQKTTVALACLGFLALLGGLLLPALARPTNCGGNSYALHACKQLVIYARVATCTNHSWLDLSRLDALELTNLFRIVDSHWTSGAGYWVRTNGLGAATQRVVVAFCDTAYDNVPQPTIWNLYDRNPAHAVAFSDGTAGLISPADFAQINRTRFTRLSSPMAQSQP